MGALVAAAEAAASVALLAGGRLEAPSADVRIGDVAVLDDLHPAARSRVAAKVLLRVPSGTSVTLPRVALAKLIRRAVPGLDVDPGVGGPVTIRSVRRTGGASGATCYAVGRPVDAGTELKPDMLTRADCASRVRAVLTFDGATGAVRARHPLAAGEAIGALMLPAPAAVRPGDRLTLTSTSGPVRVRRSVTAMQAGRAGGRVFVKAGDGSAFPAPVGPAGSVR